MENQTKQTEGAQKKTGIKYKKIIIVVVVIVVSFSAFIGWGTYKQWQMRRGVEKFAEALKQLEKEDYRIAMADTYGGKTPQETLQMYIDAVEKGDFELASKFLVEVKREDEVQGLNSLNAKNNLQSFLDILMRAESDGSITEETFRMKAVVDKEEGPYYFVRFVKYPNGVWKITEI